MCEGASQGKQVGAENKRRRGNQAKVLVRLVQRPSFTNVLGHQLDKLGDTWESFFGPSTRDWNAVLGLEMDSCALLLAKYRPNADSNFLRHLLIYLHHLHTYPTWRVFMKTFGVKSSSTLMTAISSVRKFLFTNLDEVRFLHRSSLFLVTTFDLSVGHSQA